MKTSTLKLSLLTALATIACAFGLRAANLTWDADPFTTGLQDGLGVWDTTTNTWWDGAANVTWNNGAPDNAIFGAGSGAASTVTNILPNTVGNITFNAAGSGTYTISGSAVNTLTLAGSPNITNNVDGALNVVLAGVSFTKEGVGQLSLRPAANNTYSGTTIVNNGRLALNSSTTSRILIPGDLIINAGTTVTNTGSTGPVADTATVTVNNGGTYASGGEIISTLVLNGGTVIQNSTETLTVGSVDARSGSVIESTGATGKLDGNLTKTTAGSVTLVSRGSANTAGFTNVTVNAGNLILDYTQSSGKINNTLGILTINGGTLIFTNGTTTEDLASVILAGGVITNASGTSKLAATAPGIYDVRAGEVYSILSGSGTALTKSTGGTVILALDNTYTGGTLISAGILQIGNGGATGLPGSIGVAITNNGTLVYNRSVAPANISAVISGTGSLVNIGSGTVPLTGVNTYSGSTTISNGAISITGSSTLGDGTGTLNLSGGTLIVSTARTVANPINLTADSAITTSSAASSTDLIFTNDSIGGSTGTLTLRNDGADAAADQFEPRFTGNFTFNRPIVIDNGALGKTRLNSFNTNGTTQTFNGIISGNGKFRRSNAGIGGVTILNAANTYSGDTVNTGGTLLINGAIGSGIVSNGSGGVLGGNGTINGSVIVQSGGTLSPGGSIGILAISNSLTFQSGSTCFMELNKATPTNDLVRGITTVTYAGTLVVTNLAGTLAANNTFKLFDATTYTGSFSTTNLPTLGVNLVWDITGLTNNGSIKVVSTSGSPALNVAQSGSTLTFSWTGAFKLQSQTNSLVIGLYTNWSDYPGGSTSPVGVTINPANPTVFFRLSQ